MVNPVTLVDEAFTFIFVSITLIFILLMAMMLTFLYKYRRKRHPVASQIRGNVALEVAWTVVPTALAMVMFWYGWQSYLGLRNVPENALVVKVTGRNFSWSFEYPGGKISDNLMLVPEGTAVKLVLKAEDNVHGFFIPAFRTKVDTLPDRQTYAWFYADKVGEYDIFCTVYCGAGHAEMLAKLRIVPPDEYKTWVEQKDDDF